MTRKGTTGHEQKNSTPLPTAAATSSPPSTKSASEPTANVALATRDLSIAHVARISNHWEGCSEDPGTFNELQQLHNQLSGKFDKATRHTQGTHFWAGHCYLRAVTRFKGKKPQLSKAARGPECTQDPPRMHEMEKRAPHVRHVAFSAPATALSGTKISSPKRRRQTSCRKQLPRAGQMCVWFVGNHFWI